MRNFITPLNSALMASAMSVALIFAFATPSISATLSDNAGENSVERRAVDVGAATWPTAFVVRYQNQKYIVLEGERGLTRAILFSDDPAVVIPWANAAFGENFRMDGDGGGVEFRTETFTYSDGEDTLTGTREITGPGNGANF